MGRPRSTHCRNGHELSGENLQTMGNKRMCRICRKAWETSHAEKVAANPAVIQMTDKELERFFKYVDKPEKSSCWIWTGSQAFAGYGHFNLRGRLKRTHRALYEHVKGPIPEGLELDHLCRNRLCVNPDHLEPVTHAENVRRGYEHRTERKINAHTYQTHCLNGHEFTEENTLYSKTGKQSRTCRTCQKARMKLWQQENRDYVNQYNRAYRKQANNQRQSGD